MNRITVFILFFTMLISKSFAQQVYCNGPWGGSGEIGDPARWTFISQASNPADPTTGKGSVSYDYSFFDRFVRIGDWLTFLNAVDSNGSGDFSGLLGDNGMEMITYNGSQWIAKSWSCSATGQSFTATQVSKIAVSYVSFNLYCRFANWVATGNVNTGAYSFASSAANANVSFIDYSFSGVRLPTENEFYKAAYYNPTTEIYNTYGSTNLVAGIPIQTDVNSDGTLMDQSGTPHSLSMAGLYGGANGTHCLWQIQAGQGSKSAYGIYNMVGGFHHVLTINEGGTVDATAGFMMFRPGNQLEGPMGQSKMWSYPGSANDPSWTMDAHLASPSFHLVIKGNECGGCSELADPAIPNASRCGMGTIPINITTGCTTSGSSLHIFSDAGITIDVTSQFTISGTTITTPSISSTKTYFAVCQSTTGATTCFSKIEQFTATVNNAPIATATANNATCNVSTGVANSDANIILDFTTGQRYQYTNGVSFTGAPTPASINAIPIGGVIANSLPNAAQSYTVRIYDPTDNTCFVDRVVSTRQTNCDCSIVPALIINDKNRCGTGSITTEISTTCISGTTLKIFSNNTLVTDITNQFTINGNTITSPSITSGTTMTYYAACQLDSSPSCLSTGSPFKLTAKANPVALLSATQPLCIGTNSPNNGSIKIESFTAGQRYQYTSGSIFSGTVTPTTITLIPTGGVITSTLNNTTQDYTVRIYDSTDNTCFVDRVVNISSAICCTTPTSTALVTQPTCNGSNSPNNGGITILNSSIGQRYQYSVGATFASGSATPASITTIPAGGVITSGLSNVTQQYTVRIYDSVIDNCYVDRIVSITAVECINTPSAGADFTICLPSTTINLVDATAGQTQWMVGSGNPATTTINAISGIVTGLTVAGTYTFTLQTIGDSTYKDDIQVIVYEGDEPKVLCNDGTTSYTLSAQTGLKNIKWYNMANEEVGTGSTLIVSSNTLGLADGIEAYYYVGESMTLIGNKIELCCPVKFQTQSCCSTPNCLTITVKRKKKDS